MGLGGIIIREWMVIHGQKIYTLIDSSMRQSDYIDR